MWGVEQGECMGGMEVRNGYQAFTLWNGGEWKVFVLGMCGKVLGFVYCLYIRGYIFGVLGILCNYLKMVFGKIKIAARYGFDRERYKRGSYQF